MANLRIVPMALSWCAAALLACVGALAAPVACMAAPPLQAIARSTVGESQGVYAEAEDGTVLADLNGERPVHPASVSKVAATLALLDHLGPAYRFDITFSADGPIHGDTLDGNLIVEAHSDPFFVFEDAFLCLAELRSLGIRRVRGGLRIEGPFVFNWQPDDGMRLLAALTGSDGASAWAAMQRRRTDLAGMSLQAAGLKFANERTTPSARQALFVHRSPKLLTIMKALNSYSNNVFHTLSTIVGGPAEVERIARERVPSAERAEMVIHNAAGAGFTNRMSPRAAARLVRALDREASEHALTLHDLLPVAGIDRGTLEKRFDDETTRGMVVAKTGTYAEIGISALAGAVKTKRHGVVIFAVLNKGLDVSVAKVRQEAFVRALVDEAGGIRSSYVGPAPDPLLEARIDPIR